MRRVTRWITAALFLGTMLTGTVPGLAEPPASNAKIRQLETYLSGSFRVLGEDVRFTTKVGDPMRVTDNNRGYNFTLSFDSLKKQPDGSVHAVASVIDFEGPISNRNFEKIQVERSFELSEGVEESLFGELGLVLNGLALKPEKSGRCDAAAAPVVDKIQNGDPGLCCVHCQGFTICACAVTMSCGSCCVAACC